MRFIMDYTKIYDYKCPTDASKVTHTVTFTKSTCDRFDDSVTRFKCSRDSKCAKCAENYR